MIPKLVNRSEITTKGSEMTIRVNARQDLILFSHLTYVKTDIKDTDEELRNRPEWRGGFDIQWQPLSSLFVHLDVLYVGEVLDSSIPTGDLTLDPYTRVNIALTWIASPRWKYFLAISNLFDADYEEAVGFPAPGITPRIGLRATW